jgi:hypothetical protein
MEIAVSIIALGFSIFFYLRGVKAQNKSFENQDKLRDLIDELRTKTTENVSDSLGIIDKQTTLLAQIQTQDKLAEMIGEQVVSKNKELIDKVVDIATTATQTSLLYKRGYSDFSQPALAPSRVELSIIKAQQDSMIKSMNEAVQQIYDRNKDSFDKLYASTRSIIETIHSDEESRNS